MTTIYRLAVAAAAATCAFPVCASAYIGPGAGIGVIGSFLALLGALFLAVAIVLSWPIRRMLRRARRPGPTAQEPQPPTKASLAGDPGA